LPLAVGPVEGAKHHILLHGTAAASQSPPLLVNAGPLGYARVLYRAQVFDSLKPHLVTLAAVDQLGLLNDSWAFATAGDAPASQLMDLPSLLPPRPIPLGSHRL